LNLDIFETVADKAMKKHSLESLGHSLSKNVQVQWNTHLSADFMAIAKSDASNFGKFTFFYESAGFHKLAVFNAALQLSWRPQNYTNSIKPDIIQRGI
jgi:hypothetical protein